MRKCKIFTLYSYYMPANSKLNLLLKQVEANRWNFCCSSSSSLLLVSSLLSGAVKRLRVVEMPCFWRSPPALAVAMPNTRAVSNRKVANELRIKVWAHIRARLRRRCSPELVTIISGRYFLVELPWNDREELSLLLLGSKFSVIARYLAALISEQRSSYYKTDFRRRKLDKRKM